MMRRTTRIRDIRVMRVIRDIRVMRVIRDIRVMRVIRDKGWNPSRQLSNAEERARRRREITKLEGRRRDRFACMHALQHLERERERERERVCVRERE
jgi:hypothetical protein